MGTSSARPQRLQNFGETADAVRDGLKTRAGFLADAWAAYRAGQGADWRFDFGDLPDAIRGWADTLARIGAFTRDVGDAFEEAGGAGDDVVEARHARIRNLLDDRWHEMLEAGAHSDYLDWGDPDHPPPWLETLRTTSFAFGLASDGTNAFRVTFIQSVAEHTRAGTRVRAHVRYRRGMRARLGRFASARSVARFNRWFGRSAAAFTGLSAGLDQWARDSAGMNYTDEEQLARALARGGFVGGAAALGGAGGAWAAGQVCLSTGPYAPACAAVVIIGAGLVATGVADRIMDSVVDEPAPAEHDPAIVRDEIASGVDFNEMEATYEAAGQLGRDAAVAQSAHRETLMQALAFDPEAAEAMELPTRLPDVEYAGDMEVVTDWIDVGAVQPAGGAAEPPPSPTPEDLAAIDEYERSSDNGVMSP